MAAKKSGRKTARKKTTRERATPKRAASAPEPDEPGPDPAEEADDVVPADLSALKDGKLYYRIGEVSQITGVKPYVLRYWESEFRLMAPQ